MSLVGGASAAGLAARLVERVRGRHAPNAAVAELAARHEALPDAFALGGVDLAAEE